MLYRLALFFSIVGLSAFAAEKPNVIFVLTDDLGYGDLGVFFQNARRDSGDRAKPAHFTPQLDRMAAQGARFTSQYVAAPVCVSSRASLLQGVHQGNCLIRDNQFDKALEDNHTMATVLREAGYATAAIGKWGLQGAGEGPDWPSHPTKRGFDYYYGYIRHVDGHEHYPKESLYFGDKKKSRGAVKMWENRTDVTASLDACYTTDLFTARAKQWITDHQSSAPKQPFFLYLAFDTPHAVLELPTQAFPQGGGLKGGMKWLGKPGAMINTASGTIDSWIHPDYANATYDDDSNPATPEKPWPDVYRRYATSVRRIDDGVGDLLQLLRDLRLDQNTLVVFTSDNGPSIESYLPEKITPEFFASYGPFDGIKRDLWEGGVRVPTVALWPARIAAGRVITEPTGTWDWLSTFAAAAGMAAPARSDGISLLPALTGKGKSTPRESLYFEYTVEGRTPKFKDFEPNHRDRIRGQMQAVRLGDLMGVRYNIANADDDFEIYNVANDPKEAKDLAKAVTETAAVTQKRMKAIALQSHRPNASSPRPYDGELVPANPESAVEPGAAWQSYAGSFKWVPQFEGLKPSGRGVQTTVNPGALKSGANEGLFFSGFIRVPADGDYVFSMATDTGAVLRIHDTTIIDADYGYESGTEKTGTLRLQAGLHAFRLSYRHGKQGSPALDWNWSGPGFAKKPVSELVHVKPSSAL